MKAYIPAEGEVVLFTVDSCSMARSMTVVSTKYMYMYVLCVPTHSNAHLNVH